MSKEREALKQLLEALDKELPHNMKHIAAGQRFNARTALAQPEQEPKCNPHPKAPHGFNRNASHANDRYTCECESWDAYDAGYQAGVLAGIEASMGEPKEPEQEPVAWLYESPMPDGSIFVGASAERLTIGVGVTPDTKETPLYTTQPQLTWVGLTDEEKSDIWYVVTNRYFVTEDTHVYADAIEAKLKEKNT